MTRVMTVMTPGLSPRSAVGNRVSYLFTILEEIMHADRRMLMSLVTHKMVTSRSRVGHERAGHEQVMSRSKLGHKISHKKLVIPFSPHVLVML